MTASNLILQHWHAQPLPAIVEASSANIRAYAERIGADYRLLLGYPFHPEFSCQAQKLAVLHEWGEYDKVAMLDSDMAAIRGLAESVFDQPGHGWHHTTAHPRVVKHFPALARADRAFWGGAIYVFDRAMRDRLRHEVHLTDLHQLDNPAGGWDEGMMHRLAVRAGIPHEAGQYISFAWCWPSYDANPEAGKIIHIRPKTDAAGRLPRRDKHETFRQLQARGII